MTQTMECDLAIIGAGAAGLSVAAVAAQLDLQVVLCEGGKMGGDCLNYGCIPSKALLAIAKRFWHIRHNQDAAIDVGASNLDYAKVKQYVDDAIAKIAPHDSVERFQGLGVNVIRHHAHFIDKQHIKAGEHIIRARRFIIATGSRPAIPAIDGLSEVDYLTNETIFSLQHQPKHLIVIGGGPIGCELAQAYAMLGSKVSIIEGFSLLNKDDAQAVDLVKQSLLECGVEIYQHAKVESVYAQSDNISVTIEYNHTKQTISGSELLVATGRKANIEQLNLSTASIEYANHGIIVDKRMRTANKKCYAIGDVCGQLQFTHAANYHAGLVIKHCLFKLPVKVDYAAMPWVTYTYPELAHVGLTEKQCQQQQLNYQRLELDYQQSDRAIVENAKGKLIVLVDTKARILGVSIVGDNAGELIVPWTLLIKQKKPLRELTEIIIAYPGLSELSKKLAGQYYQDALFSTKVKKLVRLLMALTNR